MQFKLRGRSGASLLSALLVLGLLTAGADAAQAKVQKKGPSKGSVPATAGDGASAAASASVKSYAKGGKPKWVQYDEGGLYYFDHRDYGKARQYWMESFREAQALVPAERAQGLKPGTAQACCRLIYHLSFFVTNNNFKTKGSSISSSIAAGTNPAQFQLDQIKASLRDMDQDWDWYERICNFADRAIGKQRDCMRQICSERSNFERKIVFARQSAQTLERQLGVDPRYSSIDVRPLRWGGVEGAGNPFYSPNSNPVPLNLRGGALPIPKQ